MALARDEVVMTAGRENLAYVLTTAVTAYSGALLGLDMATGLAVLWSDTAGVLFLGLNLAKKIGNAAGTPPIEVEVNCTGPVEKKATVSGVASIANVGDLVYATDDNTLTLTPTINVGPIGEVTRWYVGTTCDVKLFTPDEYRAWGGF